LLIIEEDFQCDTPGRAIYVADVVIVIIIIIILFYFFSENTSCHWLKKMASRWLGAPSPLKG
jgi:uncharacterized membrane protein YvbJ